jgi:predicted PurR-regulated permease PerM
MQITFNNRLRQVIILSIIILLALLLLKQLYVFVPGFLGAITLYILFREWYFSLTIKKKWNKTWLALLFILASIIIIAFPLYYSISVITNKTRVLLSNPVELMMDAKIVGQKIYEKTGYNIMTEENLQLIQKKASTIIPVLLNSSAGILSNFAILFFLLYFMLKSGREMEKNLGNFIPLKEENVNQLGKETKNIIKANAIGIPVLAVLQGIIATVGYWLFGVNDFVLWGIITGIFSMVPIVGTAIIWVPLTLYLYSIGQSSNALWLLIYALVLITNIDYVARLTILKKLLNVHPVNTIFGVIIGIGLFGFWGVIFGPLLISYFIILIKIYINEFGAPKDVEATAAIEKN